MKRLILIVTVIAVAACADDGPLTAPPDPTVPARPQAVDLTPFQQSIQSRFAERAADGLPTPDVSYSSTSDNGVPLSALQDYAGVAGDSFTVVATTTIRFGNPEEAGLDRWPSNVITGEIPPEEGMIREGDYDDEVRSYVAERIPGFWQRHEFGYEPRTRTITETITVTYGPSAPWDVARSVVEDDLVHGFTFVGPNIDWTVGDRACIVEDVTGIEVCAWEFRAGFAMDWGFGMRLPMTVSLTANNEAHEGDTFTPISRADGADWSAADFTAAGLPPESGNEFVMRYEFFLGAQVKIAEISVVDIGPDIDEDESSSFKTPFGPGAVFDLPTIDVPLITRSLAKVELEFGAAITPQAGSDEFRANWVATSGLLGNGALIYTDPDTDERLASVFAVDGPAAGNLQIKDTKYVFNQYKIALGAYFQIDIFGLFTDRFPIPITDFDLSNLIPDISVPIHAGASPTTLNSGVTVLNVAPTAAIDVAGAQVINGADVFFADVGEAIPFQGASYDPGLDDLVLAWSFGDGTPDTSTPYPLPVVATTGPNDVSEGQPHAFSQACLYPVTFTSTDSDGGSSQDGAFAIVRSAVNDRAGLAGYWRHQLSGNGKVDLGEDELGCLLAIVSATSTVFPEARDASTVGAALAVVALDGNQGSVLEKLDRELLIGWMNFANGVFDLDDMVDTDLDAVPDTPFGVALSNAEGIRLDPLATHGQLQMQREIVHDIIAQGT
jgi:predicted small lipoprotein YifL